MTGKINSRYSLTNSMKKFDFKKAIFGKIETKEEARKIIRESSNGFLILGIICIVASFFVEIDVGIDVFINGVLFAILALLLKKFNSRTAAILLLLLSIGIVVVTGINKFGGGQGGRNIFLALVIAWTGVRAMQGSFVYNKLPK